MPRRERPEETTRSEKRIREAVNDHTATFNRLMLQQMKHPEETKITWYSPIKNDDYAEYYDQSFIDRIEIENLKVPLKDFWPARGPRWDGLAKTEDGRIILVEAKSYIEESVDYHSRAGEKSMGRISKSLQAAKKAFHASKDANWETPFYQYANRLAHLYFLAELNKVDAYLLFVYFADDKEVPNPCSRSEWQGAVRLTRKCMGLKDSRLARRVLDLIISVKDWS